MKFPRTEQLAIINGAPAENDGTPKARRAVKKWKFDCKSMRELIVTFDGILAPKPPPLSPDPGPETPPDVEQDVDRLWRVNDVARFPKGKCAEMCF